MKRTFTAIVVALLGLGGMAQATFMETVVIGNAGNSKDVYGTGYGSVSYNYNIGKYEVSNTQYVEFLNGVGETKVSAYGLWNASSGITNTGSGATKYAVTSSYANRPVIYVSWFDTLRFANWMTNTNGLGTGSGDTESGSYTITNSGVNSGTVIIPVHSSGTITKWFLTSEDEWYKAAYYDPNKTGGAGYWGYPTGSDTVPTATAGGTNPNTAVIMQGTTANVNNAGGLSVYGTMGQGGNVQEWNEAKVGGIRNVRGGSFTDFYLHASSSRIGYLPAEESYRIGFRVSQVYAPQAVPEPATLLGFGIPMLMIGIGKIKGLRK